MKDEINKITKKYGVHCLSAIRNGRGSVDIELDQNIYFKVQEKMEQEIKEALFLTPINDIYYKDVA